MLELRLIFYSILMRQTKADKQTPTPTTESTLMHTHTHARTLSHMSHGSWPVGRWRQIRSWALYTQLQGASNQSQTRGHGLSSSASVAGEKLLQRWDTGECHWIRSLPAVLIVLMGNFLNITT